MSVALVSARGLEAELTTEEDRVHSERLLPAIDRLLESAGRTLDDVDAYAVSIGPGSFTGLRVALATVKGLVLGDDRPVVAVPTLAALAAGAAAAPGPVAALLDARRGEVYGAMYAAAGSLDATLPEGVYRPEELAERLPAEGSVVVGEGAGPVALRLAELRPELDVLPAGSVALRAEAVGVLGRRRWAAGDAVAAETLLPRYVRRAEAEVKRTGERFEP